MTEKAEKQELRRKERQAALEAVAAEILEEVGAWAEAHPEAKWDEIEGEVLRARKRFGEGVLEQIVKEREERRQVPGPKCPQCGKEMHYKGKKSRYVVSSLGETQIERGYYYCSQCKRSVFPPG